MKLVDFFSGVYFTIFGLVWILFHKKLGRFAANRWNKFSPNIKVSEASYQITILLVGIIFTLAGILYLLGIIKSKT